MSCVVEIVATAIFRRVGRPRLEFQALGPLLVVIGVLWYKLGKIGGEVEVVHFLNKASACKEFGKILSIRFKLRKLITDLSLQPVLWDCGRVG